MSPPASQSAKKQRNQIELKPLISMKLQNCRFTAFTDFKGLWVSYERFVSQGETEGERMERL
jgi:hypothetical protein